MQQAEGKRAYEKEAYSCPVLLNGIRDEMQLLHSLFLRMKEPGFFTIEFLAGHLDEDEKRVQKIIRDYDGIAFRKINKADWPGPLPKCYTVIE